MTLHAILPLLISICQGFIRRGTNHLPRVDGSTHPIAVCCYVIGGGTAAAATAAAAACARRAGNLRRRCYADAMQTDDDVASLTGISGIGPSARHAVAAARRAPCLRQAT